MTVQDILDRLHPHAKLKLLADPQSPQTLYRLGPILENSYPVPVHWVDLGSEVFDEGDRPIDSLTQFITRWENT